MHIQLSNTPLMETVYLLVCLWTLCAQLCSGTGAQLTQPYFEQNMVVISAKIWGYSVIMTRH